MSEVTTGQLSQSACQAMQWAGILARFRTEFAGDDPNSAHFDSYDLFLGMMLAHPGSSEPGMLLEHFHLTPGQVLPEDYPRPAADDLRRHMAAVPDEKAVTADPEAAAIIEAGTRLVVASIDGDVAEVKSLFTALIKTGNRAARALEGLLSSRGASLHELGVCSEEYVLEGGDFAEILRERFPFKPDPMDIPNFKADRGPADDLLDMRPEVDAFAYLLASTGLQPPLAVGLFGDWGSGKTFFMENVEQRIRALTTDPLVVEKSQSRLPFWKRIVQIRFNAWNHLEGDLWTGLVNHILDQLRFPGEDEAAVQERRRHWIGQLDSTRLEVANLEQKMTAAERELQQHRDRVASSGGQRDQARQKLEQVRLGGSGDIAIEDSRTAINQALQPLMLSVLGSSPDEVFGKLQEARQELRRGRVFLDYYTENFKRTLLLMAGVLGVPLVAWTVSLFTGNALAALLGGVAVAAGAGTALLGRSTAWTRSQLDRIEKAEARVRKEISTKRTEWQKAVDTAQAELDAAEESFGKIQDKEAALLGNIAEIREQMDNADPAALLEEFVAGRTDTAAPVGVPARFQRDFETIAGLVADHNRAVLDSASDVDEDATHAFNRIILYIDDLDRCPDEHVVKVLQAVHLLLANELFVVVVAADSRWLDQALQRHYGTLSQGNDGATSDDFLEKIFQVPFWIRPLGDGARHDLIAGLMGGHLARAGAEEEDLWDHSGLELSQAEEALLGGMGSGAELPVLEAADLVLTGEELEFLDGLAPLLGGTPRAVKRFANLYQLARIIHRSRPGRGGQQVPGDSELIAFALAVGDGIPGFAQTFMDKLAQANPSDTLGTVLGQMHDPKHEAGRERLLAWLVKNDWMNVRADRAAKFIEPAERFLFRVER